ncbi:MAG: tryptophan synthase subunit beta, partial [Candidatus Dormibacteraceae bacterium]
FTAFLGDDEVELIGVEAAGRGMGVGDNAASLVSGRPGVLHGAFSYLLQDSQGQIATTHSISAGLDYPGVGPEHAFLRDEERATYVAVSDQAAVDAFHRLTELEGILPALESAHALAYAERVAARLGPESQLLICLSGRGDKDLNSVEEWGR